MTLTFADIKNRSWALETAPAKYLLSKFPSNLADKFKLSFLANGIERREAKEIHRFLLKNSTISRIVTARPSSAETFEYLYHKRKVDNEIDRYFMSTKAGISIYQRLAILREMIPEIIRSEIGRVASSKEHFIIFNVGSGPGHDMIEVLEKNLDLASKVKVYCIDPDEKMLEVGRKRAKELGFSDSFIFIPEKFEDTNIGLADMVLMIGIFCPMAKNVSIKLLKRVAPFAELIIFNTVQKKMLEEDPLTDYLMRLCGWRMDYKDDTEPFQIAREAGLKPVDYFYDPTGYNCMLVCRRQK